jgi:hypothetical protein
MLQHAQKEGQREENENIQSESKWRQRQDMAEETANSRKVRV